MLANKLELFKYLLPTKMLGASYKYRVSSVNSFFVGFHVPKEAGFTLADMRRLKNDLTGCCKFEDGKKRRLRLIGGSLAKHQIRSEAYFHH